MRVVLAWPSASQVSSRTFKYVLITDFDRIPDNIDGEGGMYEMARTRVQTFQSGGMVIVESSPGRLITDTKYIFKNTHEGPPSDGIFRLYNKGTKCRFYWKCPECGQYFSPPPTIEAFTLINDEVKAVCQINGCVIDKANKYQMNLEGVWLEDGQTIDTILDKSNNASASYWLTGPCSGYQSWASLWAKYSNAITDYEKTGTENAIQTVTTNDFGMAFKSLKIIEERTPELITTRVESWKKKTVPDGVKYLIAAVDVQGNRFVVQVVGYGKGFQRWLIDRYNIKWSNDRKDSNGAKEPINPPRYLEDWKVLDDLPNKLYPMENNESVGMPISLVAIDSAGKENTTDRAYSYWRYLNKNGKNKKIRLIKGGNNSGPRVNVTYPDSTGKGNKTNANAFGIIPVIS